METETAQQKWRRLNPVAAREQSRVAQATWRAKRRDLRQLANLEEITDMEDEDQ